MVTSTNNYRSDCPLATALDVVGDKWSLLLVRDMCMNKNRYGDFIASPEGIPTNILASRLRRLEETGIVIKKPYQTKPLRYEYLLTAKGAELLPILQQLALWAYAHVADCQSPPDWFIQAKSEDIIKQQTVR